MFVAPKWKNERKREKEIIPLFICIQLLTTVTTNIKSLFVKNNYKHSNMNDDSFE